MGDTKKKNGGFEGTTAPIVLAEEALPGGFRQTCRVPADLVYFHGHFDRAAVVAGVVQLKWVMDAIAAHAGSELNPAAMEAVKFHHLLFPGQEFVMEAHRDETKGKWTYRIVRGSQKIASGRLVEPREPHAGESLAT